MARADVFNIYQNKSNPKWIVLSAALVISIGSILYTNLLVGQLKERERSVIRLYAKALEFALDESVTINQDINFISEEIILRNNSMPMIIMDSQGYIYDYKNINIDSSRSEESINGKLRKMANNMAEDYNPIRVAPINPATGEPYLVQFLYYKHSNILTQLIYYPYVQLSVIAIFGIIAYMGFSYSRTAEQNRVWVGMAKETAHQLGTPISSLMAWIEYLKADEQFEGNEYLDELDKDVAKLELITERFSSIGSVPVLKEEDMLIVVQRVADYLRARISSKVSIAVDSMHSEVIGNVNAPLFEWVIENICKNAVDAMSGIGQITIRVQEASDWRVFIDISDTGKGIQPTRMKQVFNPGFTTKKRGWGLGLALAKRIIENYHSGRVFVLSSELNKGTTFRIVLHRNKK
ncbi:MAG: HAMP domain-containing sensor histidine kinase [Bacteroidota bacterium]